jgi:phage terminase large subunit-like protein
VCTTWGVKGKHLFLIGLFRGRLEYPELKRAVREQQSLLGATEVLIEDKASGTQLIQELIAEGCLGCSATSGVGMPGLTPGARRSRARSAASALLAGSWKRVMPTSFQAIPQKPPAVSKMR